MEGYAIQVVMQLWDKAKIEGHEPEPFVHAFVQGMVQSVQALMAQDAALAARIAALPAGAEERQVKTVLLGRLRRVNPN